MTLTLYINKSDSHCECSYKSISYRTARCPNCDGLWTHVSSDYGGGDIALAVMRCRPDLIPDFPWKDWYESKEGQRMLWELQFDPNQEEEE